MIKIGVCILFVDAWYLENKASLLIILIYTVCVCVKSYFKL